MAVIDHSSLAQVQVYIDRLARNTWPSRQWKSGQAKRKHWVASQYGNWRL